MLRIKPECLPCTLNSALRLVKHATDDIEMQRKAVTEAAEKLSKVTWKESPLELTFMIQRVVFELTRVRDPYAEIKKRSNAEILAAYPKLKKVVAESGDPLKMAAKLAAAGNALDLGAYSKINLNEPLKKARTEGFVIDDYEEFRKSVLRAETLIYFLDNAGEAVLDRLLIEVMLDVKDKPFKRITIVPKEIPLLNDVALDDVEEVKFDELPNVVVRSVGDGFGAAPHPRSNVVKDWMRNHDLVLLKGQGNFETFLDYSGVFFLLVAKCPVVAGALKAPQGSLILKYSPRF